MATLETAEDENPSNYFANASSSLIFNFHPPGVAKFDKRGILNVYIIFALVVLLYFVQKNLSTRKPKPGYLSFTETLPYFQWIPFFKVQLVDGLIFWYKVRKDGIKVAEMVVDKDAPVRRFSFGLKTVIGVSDPTIIQKLLSSTNHGHLNKSQFLYPKLFTELLKDGLLASKVDIWSAHRKVMAPAFKYKSFPTYFKFIYDEAKALAQTATEEVSKTNEVKYEKIRQLVDHHTLQIVTHIVMGSESFNLSNEQRILFHENFKRIKEATVERFQRPELLIPLVWWFHPRKKDLDLATDILNKISHQITDRYRMNANLKGTEQLGQINSCLKTDPIDKNMNQKNDEELGIKPYECLVELMIKSGLSNKEITDEVATMFAAGHETVKVALGMLIFHLALNQEDQEKCRTEVDNLFDSKDVGEEYHLNLEDFSKLKYLEMCIQESMRLTPTVPVFLRDLQEPLRIDDNYIIPAGEWILILPWALHRNPNVYPNPEKFDPNRFLPENVIQRHRYSFIPFSMGMRNCIGWKVALLELKVIMAWILRYFVMYTTDGPNDVKLFFDITLKPERPHNVTFHRRE